MAPDAIDTAAHSGQIRARSSRPATTPTRMARPTSSATATTRPGGTSWAGPDPPRVTMTTGRRIWPGTSGISGSRLPRMGPPGTRTTSGRGTSSCSTPDCASAGGCGPDSAQGQWLTADLAASDATCTLAIWHHPRFSSGEHGNDAEVAPFWRALYDAGADVIVNGHDHDYERFAPQDPDGNLPIRNAVSASSSWGPAARLRPFGAQAANSEFRVTGYFGVIRLVLHATAYEWTFPTTSGAVLDAGLGTCH